MRAAAERPPFSFALTALAPSSPLPAPRSLRYYQHHTRLEFGRIAQRSLVCLGAPVRTYKVESGDTLAGIARQFYKNSGQWQKIAEANKGTLSDPTKLKPGMVLVIPE